VRDDCIFIDLIPAGEGVFQCLSRSGFDYPVLDSGGARNKLW
jgi:hypothetical protein